MGSDYEYINCNQSSQRAPPPGHPEKRLRRTRRPTSSADSASARQTTHNAPLRTLGCKVEAIAGPA
eukprot:9051682-Alexandrium_andersonii.AAC.1